MYFKLGVVRSYLCVPLWFLSYHVNHSKTTRRKKPFKGYSTAFERGGGGGSLKELERLGNIHHFRHHSLRNFMTTSGSVFKSNTTERQGRRRQGNSTFQRETSILAYRYLEGGD